MIAANNGHLLIPACRPGSPMHSAGSQAVAVSPHSDDDEVLFQAVRPTLLNGIEDIIGRPDLADRAIFLTLAPIRKHQRRSEAELWRDFEHERPRILGPCLTQ